MASGLGAVNLSIKNTKGGRQALEKQLLYLIFIPFTGKKQLLSTFQTKCYYFIKSFYLPHNDQEYIS
jgi:hypothetical protein